MFADKINFCIKIHGIINYYCHNIRINQQLLLKLVGVAIAKEYSIVRTMADFLKFSEEKVHALLLQLFGILDYRFVNGKRELQPRNRTVLLIVIGSIVRCVFTVFYS